MNVEIYEIQGTQVAEMQSKGIVIRSVRDASDVIRQLLERGVKKLILHKKNLCPEMWQVSNGLAGAILKEFSNFGIAVAFIGDFDQHKGKSLQTLIRESNLGNMAVFVDDVESAKMRLSKMPGA